jgi:hypothetical protein
MSKRDRTKRRMIISERSKAVFWGNLPWAVIIIALLAYDILSR